MNDPLSCIAMTVRTDREELIIETPQGRIFINLNPVSQKRIKAIVRAPRSIPVYRKPLQENNNADVQQG
jgi:hypothetical protein